MRGAGRRGERQASVGGPGRLRHGRYQVAVAGGGASVITARRSRELPLTWRGAGRARGRGHAPLRGGRPGRPLAGGPELCGRAGGHACRAVAHGLGEDAAERRACGPHVQARARRKRKRDKDFWREVREHRVVTAGVATVTGGPDVATLGCDGVLAGLPRPEVGRVSRCNAAEVLFHVGRRLGQARRNYTREAKPPHERHSERDPPWEKTAAEPQPAGSGMATASGSRPTAHPEAETNLVYPFLTALQILLQPLLPQPRCPNARSRISSSSSRRHNILHCPTGTSLETRRMRVPLVKVQPSVNYSPEGRRGEKNYDGPTVKSRTTLQEGRADGRGPPSLLGPPPMANGKPGDPKSALHRGPPGSRGPMIPPLLSLPPPPPRGRGPIRGGLGPRASPYGRGWWVVNTEPPFPGPGHGGPSRESFYREPRHPRRLKSWSLAKNTYPPKNSPQVIEDKSDRPVCRHFSKKGHCRYEDHCAFYHPGVNGPPL